jgi:hypothetical protein
MALAGCSLLDALRWWVQLIGKSQQFIPDVTGEHRHHTELNFFASLRLQA